jgi:hypothetical protein
MTEPADEDRPTLPEQTGDDTDAGWGEDEPDDEDDELSRYLRERPPQHGD